MIKNYTLSLSDGEKLNITTTFNQNYSSNRVLLFVHGFKGFKDWGFGPYIAQYFANCGYYSILFNFSHNGIGNIDSEFTELDKFKKNTFSREISELNQLIDALNSGFFTDVKDSPKIGIVGHSRGGAINLLASSKRKDINALAVWASVSRLDRYSNRQKEEWRNKGSFDVMNMRTKQVMSLGIELLEDIEKNGSDYLNIELAVANLNKPLLIAHGDQDLAVPIKEAQELYEWSNKSLTELFILHGCGHTFDVVHPFAGTMSKFQKLLEKTNSFFIKHL